jgi:hypothetical protein
VAVVLIEVVVTLKRQLLLSAFTPGISRPIYIIASVGWWPGWLMIMCFQGILGLMGITYECLFL